MQFAICTVAAAPVRKEPSHRTEMINQLLFGETMEVVQQQEEWYQVRSLYDGYEGWLTWHMITEINETIIQSDKGYVASSLTNPVTATDQLINAPMASSLTGFDKETRLLWDEQLKYHGTYRKAGQLFDWDAFRKILHAWMNAPYLWGGRTYMGVDCSGFVQNVFKVMGVKLKRDAYQQAEQGSTIESLDSATCGDLAFFHNKDGKIIHVGILLNAQQIIHASGKVRIDTINKQGIFNREANRKTHELHSIRRVI